VRFLEYFRFSATPGALCLLVFTPLQTQKRYTRFLEFLQMEAARSRAKTYLLLIYREKPAEGWTWWMAADICPPALVFPAPVGA
jgi:hypothetical protein